MARGLRGTLPMTSRSWAWVLLFSLPGCSPARQAVGHTLLSLGAITALGSGVVLDQQLQDPSAEPDPQAAAVLGLSLVAMGVGALILPRSAPGQASASSSSRSGGPPAPPASCSCDPAPPARRASDPAPGSPACGVSDPTPGPPGRGVIWLPVEP